MKVESAKRPGEIKAHNNLDIWDQVVKGGKGQPRESQWLERVSLSTTDYIIQSPRLIASSY